LDTDKVDILAITSRRYTSYYYEKELFSLLDLNQYKFTNEEINTLEEIINRHVTSISEKEGRREYWQLRWYSAMREVSPFDLEYSRLSQKLNLTYEDFENERDIVTRISGISSPLKVDEILSKSNQEIASFMVNFRSENRWEEPSPEGLADSFKNAVEANPSRFVNEMYYYQNTYYFYVNKLLYGLADAWKNKQSFSWENVLAFIEAYITDDRFYEGGFSFKEKESANRNWVIRSISTLLCNGMQSDENAFDLDFLPNAKKIIDILVDKMEIGREKQDIVDLDYVMYLHNTVNGDILMMVFVYALRVGRSLETSVKPKWDQNIKAKFEYFIKCELLECYIFLGKYYEQFCFLDQEWFETQLIKFNDLESEEWKGFMGGLASSSAPQDTTIYKLLIPHYKRAINEKVVFSSINFGSYIRHVVSFYLWGIEDLNSDLLSYFLQKSEKSSILEFVNIIWQSEHYYEKLQEDEAAKFEKRVLHLWSYLIKSYSTTEDKVMQDIVKRLCNFHVFIPALDKVYTLLYLDTIQLAQIDYLFHSDDFFESMTRFMENVKTDEEANYVGQILNTIPVNTFVVNHNETNILEIVEFLYEKKQYDIANDICDRFTKKGYDFLIEVHKKYRK